MRSQFSAALLASLTFAQQQVLFNSIAAPSVVEPVSDADLLESTVYTNNFGCLIEEIPVQGSPNSFEKADLVSHKVI